MYLPTMPAAKKAAVETHPKLQLDVRILLALGAAMPQNRGTDDEHAGKRIWPLWNPGQSMVVVEERCGRLRCKYHFVLLRYNADYRVFVKVLD